jgi:hypothetical protein
MELIMTARMLPRTGASARQSFTAAMTIPASTKTTISTWVQKMSRDTPFRG